MNDESALNILRKYFAEKIDGIVIRMVKGAYSDITASIQPLVTCEHCKWYDAQNETCKRKRLEGWEYADDFWCAHGTRKGETE